MAPGHGQPSSCYWFILFVKQKVNTTVSKGIRGVTLIIIPHKQWTTAILGYSRWGLVSAINFSYLWGL